MNNGGRAFSRGQRSATRLAAVQALYQIDVADALPEEVLRSFKDKRWSKANPGLELPDPDNHMLDDLVLGVSSERSVLDMALDAALAERHTVERLEILLRAVLRAGAYELRSVADVPSVVVINEYVDLTHAFFAGKEPALVNAVLDQLAHDFRSAEESPDSADGR